ncbi:glucokinase [Mesorhizobium sp. BAC0120]|uniref:glucokinase n=1 Tax=Mesorhizobium sp. BAC0120 TaxID=3090670 RepID=UPI00298CCF15|nr:glucokinase [Mesorhizobium sp. BAC0120]MDW6024588.1 glucokinase [Mesorhizobium sp. BAC0120]
MTSGTGEADLQFPILIGDIGGTNARFAILPDVGSPSIEFPNVRTADHPTIDNAIRDAILTATTVRPRSTVLAVAGPVNGDHIPLTNCPWVVKPREMLATTGVSDVVVLNDFEAQALAVVALGPEHMEKIGGGEAVPEAGRVVLGPGTGLGVAGLIRACGRWIPVPGEGGHMDIGPRSPRDLEIFPHLEKIDGRISGEQILSGRGLVNAYRAVAAASNATARFTLPAEITAAALAKSDPIAEEALSFFVTCLGRTAGDLALVFKSHGGVFLTGGIAQKIVPALKANNFRIAFEDKAPHAAMMRAMPIYVITHPLAALAGLAEFARRPEEFSIQTKGRHWSSQ